MKLFSILVFAVQGVSGLMSESTKENDQQQPPFIVDGKVINTTEQWAESALERMSQQRGSVQKFDIAFAVMYRLGLPNAREYLNAVWDCKKPTITDGKEVMTCNEKTLFDKFEVPDAARRAMQAEQMKRRFRNNKVPFVVMIESMLFVHGKVPFAEYSAIWNTATGRSDGPPESDYTLDQIVQVMDELNKMLSQRPTQEKHYKRFEERFNHFMSVYDKSGKRPAEAAPGPAPAAKRARPTTVCQDAQSSFQKLLCEHAQFQEEIASLNAQLHAKNQRIGELDKMCDHHNLVGAQLKSELQSKDQHHQKSQAELRAEINVLIAQNHQLQRENAGLRQQRPQVVIKPEPRIKQEVKQEHFETKPKPQ